MKFGGHVDNSWRLKQMVSRPQNNEKSVSVLIQLSFADNAADNRHIAFSKLWMDVGQKQPKLMRTELVSKQIEFKAKLWNIKYFPPVSSILSKGRGNEIDLISIFISK